MSIQSAKGTYDILPFEVNKWQKVEQVMKDLCALYDYKEIRTPIFESTDLFVRGVGESTDIVSKEMYTFTDKGNRSVTLRPEGTAPVARSYVEHKLYADANQLTKLFYLGPMFRYERMQKGRSRQFHQFGVEALGGEMPSIDAEIIALSVNLIKRLGLKEVKVAINTLGDLESRASYRAALLDHFIPVKGELCGDCQKRLEVNPLRVLDCKVDHKHPKMSSAPKMIDYLNATSKAFFDRVLSDLSGLDIDFTIDHSLVRGIDYYNHTVFEIMSKVEGFGALTTLGAGGRYNGLVEQIGGPISPGVGVAFGIERLLLAIEAEHIDLVADDQLDVYLVSMDDDTDQFAFRLCEKLRSNHIKTDKDYFGRKVKAQFKQADKVNAKFTILIGETELEAGKVVLKNMLTQEQMDLSIDRIVDVVRQKLEERNEK